MTDTPTYHRGDRNFGTGYDMMKQIEALEDEIERLRAAVNLAVGIGVGLGISQEEVEAINSVRTGDRAALTQEGK